MNKSLCNFLCVLIFASVGEPFVYFLLFPFSTPDLAFILSPSVLLFAVLGWGTQSLIGKIKGVKRLDATEGIDITENYFSPIQSVPTLIVGIAVGIALSVLAKKLMPEADIHSLKNFLPVIIVISVALFTYLGSVIWFFPYNKLINIQTVVTVFVLCFINFIILCYFGAFAGESQYTPWNLYIFGTFSLISSAILMNQFFISRSYSGNVKAAVNGKARAYSLRIMALAGIAQAATAVIAFALLTGLIALGWGIIKILVGITFIDDAVEVGENGVAQGLAAISATGMPEWVEIIMIIIFICSVIAGILLFIFRTSKAVQDLLNKIIAFISAVIRFLFGIKEKKPKEVLVSNLSYADRVEDIKKAIKAGRRTDTDITYYDMLTHMAGLGDDDERLAYVYVVLSDVLRHKSYNIKRADTPTEISVKVASVMPIEGFDVLTEAYEQIRYGGKSPEQVSRLLNGICTIARDYIH